MKVQEEFGTFSDYIWKYTNGKPIVNNLKNSKDAPATTPLSDEISKDLKKEALNLWVQPLFMLTCKPPEWSMIMWKIALREKNNFQSQSQFSVFFELEI